jgi:hypothetical protein
MRHNRLKYWLGFDGVGNSSTDKIKSRKHPRPSSPKVESKTTDMVEDSYSRLPLDLSSIGSTPNTPIQYTRLQITFGDIFTWSIYFWLTQLILWVMAVILFGIGGVAIGGFILRLIMG